MQKSKESELIVQDEQDIRSRKYADIVIDSDRTTPPTATINNQYIVAAGATGAWSTHDTEIANGNGIGWDFRIPPKGMLISDNKLDTILQFDGSIWVDKGMAGTTLPTVGTIFASQFSASGVTDWAVTTLAPTDPDTDDPGISVVKFPDSGEAGRVFDLKIPTGVTSIKFDIRGRAESNGAGDVQLVLYERELPDNSAVTAWSAGVQMTLIALPANTLYQDDTQTITLATLGLTAGSDHQIQITRDGDDGDDDLVDEYWMRLLLPTYE